MSTVLEITPYPPSIFLENKPIPNSGLVINRTHFQAGLKALWSEVEFTTNYGMLHWCLLNIPENAKLHEGDVIDDQTIAITSCSMDKLIEFINWYRELIPAQYRLYLHRNDSFDSMEIAGIITMNNLNIP